MRAIMTMMALAGANELGKESDFFGLLSLTIKNFLLAGADEPGGGGNCSFTKLDRIASQVSSILCVCL